MNTLNLNTEELNLILTCMDIATKHGGLQAAISIIPVAMKIKNQSTSTEDTPAES